jgi:hypothetical protein
VIDAQSEGSGFNGVYDPATGKFEARLRSGPSPEAAQFGGHGVINSEVFGGSRTTVGFVAVVRDGGMEAADGGVPSVPSLEVRWNSGSVNSANFGDRAAPMWSREGTLSSLEDATGLLAEG